MKIIFTNVTNLPLEVPQPAYQVIPQWYKDSPSYPGNGEKKPNGNGSSSGTIKRCMPVFDAMTAGYIFKTPSDIYVKQAEDGTIWYEWAGVPVEFHAVEQAPLHPNRTANNPYAKLINPWAIKTPKGYSTLFIPPMHHDSPIKIFEGLVDTDTYHAAVNFPFVLKNPKFDGLIPKGTPVAQIIPFKRDSWKTEISTDLKPQDLINKSLSLQFFDKYKNMYRSKKEYN